jgi:hypothetical protein
VVTEGTIKSENLFYDEMKKLAIHTNKHLTDPQKRWKDIVDNVIASSRIEGIIISPAERKRIEKEVRKQLKK